jgi:hypothetical protein
VSIATFLSAPYQRINSRRLEHLSSLNLKIAGREVLEVGAGIGDHTGYFIDRGCRVTSSDGRAECVEAIKARYPSIPVYHFDLNGYLPSAILPHEVLYAYGVLYHVRDPARALSLLASLCKDMILLETCVSTDSDSRLVTVEESVQDPTQALDGTGCRPSRRWVWEHLQRHFDHVYLTKTQPWHEQFPLDWTTVRHGTIGLFRAIFVASRRPLKNDLLSTTLLERQLRSEV